MSQQLIALDDNVLAFPHHQLALSDPNGLLAIGGDLSLQRLTLAYQHGIFPWFSEHDPILWWSPDPRAIIHIDQLHINRTLSKFMRKCHYKVTLNHAFDQVINYCANAPTRSEDTWIVDDMVNAYRALHQQGYAHSIEVWQHGQLIGGLYGVAINGFFSGESMFFLKANASKVALVALARKLRCINVEFIDCQIQNPFLQSMGATEVSRDRFISLKDRALQINPPRDFWLASELSFT